MCKFTQSFLIQGKTVYTRKGVGGFVLLQNVLFGGVGVCFKGGEEQVLEYRGGGRIKGKCGEKKRYGVGSARLHRAYTVGLRADVDKYIHRRYLCG